MKTASVFSTLLATAFGFSVGLSAQAQTTYEPFTFTTIAGSSGSGSADGKGSAAQFQAPSALAVDKSGNIFVADTENSAIRKVAPDGTVTTFAGLAGMPGSADGQGSAARFASPGGIAVDGSGNVYVADAGNYTVRKITPSGVVSTVAGSPGSSGSANGTGSAARFSYLGGLALDGSGNLIVSDYANQTIRKITPSGVVTTLAGSPGASGNVDGAAAVARFQYPRAVAVDSGGNIYISDEQNNSIRKLSADGNVTTLAGKSAGGSNDGTGTAAGFYFPEGIAVDQSGNVYVSDSNNALIRKVTPAGVVTTLGGVPNTSSTSDGTGSGALFATPEGMAIDASGTIYVGDCFGNNAIRRGVPASTGGPGLSTTTLTVDGSSSPSTLPADALIVFEASQSDANDALEMRVQYANSATADTWTNLDNGLDGMMSYDTHDNHYVLTTNNYPVGSNLFFRAQAKTAGKGVSNSSPVGPFNITSAKTHLPPTVFLVEGTSHWFYVNNPGFPLNFSATTASQTGGLSVRLQTTSTPEVEGSWTDLNDGNNGGLRNQGGGNFTLFSGKYPSGAAVYFRVVAAASGMADSISNFVGPFNLVQNSLPTATITSPGTAGTDSSPLKLTADQAQPLQFSATGSDSDGSVQQMKLYLDGRLFHTGAGPTLNVPVTLTQGRHTLRVVPIDNLGARPYAAPQLVVDVAPAQPTARVFTMNKAGLWSAPENWTDANGQSGVPGPGDSADVQNFTASLNSGEHITVATLLGGNLQGAGSGSSFITVTKNFSWSGGTISGVTVEVSGGEGEIKGLSGGSDFSLNNSNFTIDLGATINIDVDSIFLNGIKITGKDTGSSLFNAGTFALNSALITNPPPALASFLTPAVIQGKARAALKGLASIRNSGTVKLNGIPIDLSSSSSGAAAATGHAATAASGFSQEGGVLDLGSVDRSGTIFGTVQVTGGSVIGSGLIVGDLSNSSGLIAPGHSAGVISVTGNYIQGSKGVLALEVGGLNANTPDYDQLQVGGGAALDGKLTIRTVNGFTPAASDVFVPVSYGSATGAFASVSSNAQITMNATGAVASIDPAKANPANGQPVNISTRLNVQTGDNVLFAGFIVTGPPGSTKKVIIRGLGPSLPANGTLGDPFLILNNPDNTSVTNDNWQSGDTSQIPPGFSPSNAKESVIVANLTVGSQGYSNYTAILKGAHDETGIGLLEVYDLETGSKAQLANIATRGVVQTGDNVLIGGFIIGGTEPAKMLVRATGPSSKIQGALQDTVLEIHDSNGSAVGNNDWRESQESEIAATQIAPTDDRESAVLETLLPGGYTAVVRGAGDTTGIAVVEAYNLQ